MYGEKDCLEGLERYINTQLLIANNALETDKKETKQALISEVGRLKLYLVAISRLKQGKESLVIKNCPFCNSNNVEFEISSSQGYVKCNDCDAMGPEVEDAADPICDIDAAIIAWNRRF